MDCVSCSSLFCLQCVATWSLVAAVTFGLRSGSRAKCSVHYFICKRLVKSVGGKAVISLLVYAFTVSSDRNYEEPARLVPPKVKS
jgi:hypothetical protein